MTHILLVSPNELIPKAALELKKQKLVEPTTWSKFVKTGHHKQRLPDSEDWWFYRSAGILRSIAKIGPVGTQKLRAKYGGKKNRGHKPEHVYDASGSIIRKILQQLEKSELIKQTEKGVHKGRILTAKGTSFLDKIAVQIAKSQRGNN
jgi:small subunit ribosomal protein S19e